MAPQIQHDFLPLFTKTVKVNGQSLVIPDVQSLQNTIRNLKAAVDSLAGRGTGAAQITGPLTMNSNTISGVVNSAAPTGDEAVSFALAQQNYTVFRPTVTVTQANYQIQATDGTVSAKASQVATNQQLPPASTVLGHCFTVKKVDPTANGVFVTTGLDPITGKQDQIDGAPNYKLGAANQYVTVQAAASGTYLVVAEGTGDPFEIMSGPLALLPLLAPAQLYFATDAAVVYIGTNIGHRTERGHGEYWRKSFDAGRAGDWNGFGAGCERGGRGGSNYRGDAGHGAGPGICVARFTLGNRYRGGPSDLYCGRNAGRQYLQC